MTGSAEILAAKILVIDDREANVRLIEGMLRIAGYTRVHSTMNPREVCGLHAANQYDLLLLDLQMPGMDGFEVMEALQKIESDGYLPVLVITAQPDHRLRALEAGAKDFVSKPFDFAELRARVHNLLEVRLLHVEARRYCRELEETVRELELSREVIRLKTLEERERSEQELLLAQETQESLLPRCLPKFENFRVDAFNKPTRYVGGDFYDFRQLSSGEWMGVLADVSGKGMPAALLSSMVLGALSVEFRSTNDPAKALHGINLLLCDRSLASQFVTLFLFVTRADGAGKFISAGHNPAYLYRCATGLIEKLAANSCALGIFEGACWQACPYTLATGDMMVVYSDGLTDAENPREQMFGDEMLLNTIRAHAAAGSLAVKEAVLRAVEDFTQGVPQTDDITFVVVEKCG